MKIIGDNGGVRWGNLFLLLILVVIFVTALGVAARYIGLIGGYVEKPAQILDVNNVEAEYKWFYEQHTALKAIRANIASTQKKIDSLIEVNGGDRTKWTMATRDEYSQYIDLRTQQETAYNSNCAAYQARWDNIFHNLVAPKDIPRDCEMIK